MKRYEDRISQIDATSGRQETYKDFRIQTIRIAIEMKKRGVCENDVISVCSRLHSDTFKPIIASFLIGTKTISLDPTLSLDETIYLLKTVTPRLIFCCSSGISLLENAIKKGNLNCEIISFDESLSYSSFNEFIRPNPDEFEFVAKTPASAQDTALMFFSSGTTGRPKAICLSHFAFLSQTTSLNDDMSNQNVVICYSSPYWISSHIFLASNFAKGNIRIIPKPFEEYNLMVTIQKYQVSSCLLTPYYIQRIIKEFHGKSIPFKLSSLEYVPFGGSAISRDQIVMLSELFPNAKLVNLYGMTETAGIITKFVSFKDTNLLKRKLLSCGTVSIGCTLKIVDEKGNNLPKNSNGEICVKSRALMNGYYTKDGFSNNFLDENGWYHTGDIGYFDDECFLFVVDREKQMLKYQGYQISPVDVEDILLMHPMVEKAVIFGKPDVNDGEHPTAAVVLTKQANITEQQIIDYVNEKVDERRKIRGGVYFVKNIPTTPSGKIRKNLMRDLILNQKTT